MASGCKNESLITCNTNALAYYFKDLSIGKRKNREIKRSSEAHWQHSSRSKHKVFMYDNETRQDKKQESSQSARQNISLSSRKSCTASLATKQSFRKKIGDRIVYDKRFLRESNVLTPLQKVAKIIKEKTCKRILIMAGAGISTPSGIPDFRSRKTGLYNRLKEYPLSDPSDAFDINYFYKNPQVFYEIAKNLYPGRYKPNYSHYFIKLLCDEDVLVRIYTQNIDGLEKSANVPSSKLVEAHGTFSSASCICCRKPANGQLIESMIINGEIPKCRLCSGIVKPDIVFFGEDLPKRFFKLYKKDLAICDLAIIMGTSLQVEPFASLVEKVPHGVPRVLINREVVGPFTRRKRRFTDIIYTGDIIDGLKELVDNLGLREEMIKLLLTERNRKR